MGRISAVSRSDFIMALRDPSFPLPKSISLNSVVKMETTFVSHNSLGALGCFYCWIFKVKRKKPGKS